MRPLPLADAIMVGLGARSATGLTPLQVTMSARARIFTPRESFMVDRHGEPIATSRLRSIGDQVMGIDRLLALGAPALGQATFDWMRAAHARGAAEPLPVIVAIANESRPGFDPRCNEHLLPALAERARVPIDRARSELVTRCRGGGVIAFERALSLLQRGASAVAVGGIDSYHEPDVLEWLDAERRLHGLGTENGFVPGEGAAFVVLASRRHTYDLPRYGQVLAAASALEPHPYGDAEPCIAQGITEAMRRAAAPLGASSRRIPWALTDVANERHRVTEWCDAFSRVNEAFSPDAVHGQPLLKTGDVGAASAAMLLVMGAVQWSAGCARGDCAMIATHSDGAERGATLASMDPAA